ncbi:MAG: cytochrome c [Acidobacteria bacterium]|nr:cytochrome c [Acidobacteriota bacterium]
MKRALSVLAGAWILSCGVAGDAAAQAPAATGPTFTKDVAPILNKHCVSCHRPGEIGPMSFQSYETTRPWARSIKDKVVKREMPPWAADPAHSMKMGNDRSLSQAEIDTLVGWAGGGAPRGNPADLPPAPTFASGWQLGEPDFVFEQPVAWTVKPDAQEPYLYFYEKIPFSEDKFATSVEIRPSNFSVVHHSGVYIVDIPDGYTVKDGYLYDTDGKQVPPSVPMGKKATSGDGTPLAGADKIISYVPGRGYEKYPDGYAKRVPANKYVRWVMHYNPTGQPETDRSKLGLWWAKGPVRQEVLNLQAGDPVPGSGGRGLYFAQGKEVLYESDDTTGRRGKTPTIPPYVGDFKMMGITPVNEPITLYALTPHMHLRGKSMKWWVTYPDGREEVILDVPNFDFNWQIQYELATPLKIPAGSKITNVAIYDNSVNNKWNPAPEKEVYWSEQSWDEMYQPTTQFSVDSQDLTKTVKRSTSEQPRQRQ